MNERKMPPLMMFHPRNAWEEGECDHCGEPIEQHGNAGFIVFPTREDWQEEVNALGFACSRACAAKVFSAALERSLPR